MKCNFCPETILFAQRAIFLSQVGDEIFGLQNYGVVNRITEHLLRQVPRKSNEDILLQRVGCGVKINKSAK